jgi:hypothetical protein
MDFPNNPTVGTQVNNGISIWTWNGKQWQMGASVPSGPYVPPLGNSIVFQFL